MAHDDFHGIRAQSPIDALCIAAANTLLEEMQALLDDGVDIDGIASYSGSTPLATAAEHGLLRSVEFLLERGAKIDLPGGSDMTPLMHACAKGEEEDAARVALRLIEAGADVTHVRSSDEMTALKFAVHESTPEVIQALIDRGAEVDGPPGTEQTALMLAARADNVRSLEVLVRNGADVSLPCKLPWAENRTARGLAELEGRRRAAAYLASLGGPAKAEPPAAPTPHRQQPPKASSVVKMIASTFEYFETLAKTHDDAPALGAVREVRDRMVREVGALSASPTSTEMRELCRRWRSQRRQPAGPASLPPDLFIESVCQALEVSLV